jgi:prepilin-type N-terminal cleavage/methylation domain-containing protein
MKNQKHKRAFTLTELLVTISIIGILSSLLLPVLSQSKVKSKRIQCLSNLTQISRALTMYGGDHEGRLPWQILPADQKVELGSGWHDFSMDPAAIFTLAPMKNEIGNPRVLLSPLDPEREASNDIVAHDWSSYDMTRQKIIPMNAISYLLAEGGDLGRSDTILSTTRNLSVCDLAQARWVGADENPIPRDAMAGLMKGQGNAVFADGSAHYSTDEDLGGYGNYTRQHQLSTGGNISGASSTVMLGCCGGYEETPIDEVFDPKDGDHHVFIIDKSGSMRQDNRLRRAQSALINSLRLLSPKKKFYVYFFDSHSTGMPGSSRRGFAHDIDLCIDWINNMNPNRSTNPLGSISDAFTRIQPDTIWILTDGHFNCPGRGTAVRQLINELNVGNGVTVNTIGFHRNPEGVDSVLGIIAQENGGTYFFSRSGQ